ncbi:Pectinesterase inhibitor domain [Macleaya cordata]|uniref:Pectinesterase inhibitor domain n=1 Tax=Macleaya cordata TaxID=56857 RepID=A0A200QL83_MACCD|nr:Pectinesterase inhibitor domain [Macleaya cordata]
MGSSLGHLLLVFLLSLFFPCHHQLVTGDTDLIQKTCKNTNYYKLCISSLKSNSSSLKADTRGLAVIMIGVGLVNATGTSTYLSSQLLSNTNDTLMKKVLKECADKYLYANDALQASLQELATTSYDYAFVHVTAAKDYPNGCHNAYKRFRGLMYPSEMARREDYLVHICEITLGIINLLLDW